MIRFVTIHGTNVDSTSVRGGQWWQTEGHFRQMLESYLREPNTCRWHHVRWSGLNSEKARRAAVSQVHDTVDQLLNDHPEDTVVLLAHSHGGNIAIEAMKRYHGKKQVRSIIYGAPFVKTRFRWPNYIMPFCAYVIAVLMAFYTVLDGVGFGYGLQQLISLQGIQITLYSTLSFMMLFAGAVSLSAVAYIRFRPNIASQFKQTRLERKADFLNSGRIVVLSLTEDEPINALRHAKSEKFDIATNDNVQVPILITFPLIAFGLYVLGQYAGAISDQAISQALVDRADVGNLLLIVDWLIFIVLAGFCTYVIGRFKLNNWTASLINFILKRNLLRVAFGDDHPDYTVHGFSYNPEPLERLFQEYHVDRRWRRLPPSLDVEVAQQLGSEAASAL